MVERTGTPSLPRPLAIQLHYSKGRYRSFSTPRRGSDICCGSRVGVATCRPQGCEQDVAKPRSKLSTSDSRSQSQSRSRESLTLVDLESDRCQLLVRAQGKSKKKCFCICAGGPGTPGPRVPPPKAKMIGIGRLRDKARIIVIFSLPSSEEGKKTSP